jgi:hypothetical protein
MTIDESARRLGGLVWTERRLFELLGAWVPTTAEPAVKVALAEVSRRHGDHAVSLVGLLPDTRDHQPEALVQPVDDADTSIAAAAEAVGTGARLRALSDTVVAAHLGALDDYLADASPVRDGPGIRVVAAVLAEDRSDFDALRALGDRVG